MHVGHDHPARETFACCATYSHAVYFQEVSESLCTVNNDIHATVLVQRSLSLYVRVDVEVLHNGGT